MNERLARALTFFLAVVLLTPAAASAQQSGGNGGSDPAWLLLEQGNLFFERGEFGAALRSYQNALAEAAVMPEAELGIARVYASQADQQLAIRFYRSALEQADQFDLPGMPHMARLELSELYRREGRTSEYEAVLLEIVAEDTLFSDPQEQRTRAQMRELLLNEGLNRLLVLYRLEEPFSTEAHRRLAAHYLEGGQDAALDHAMFAVVKIYTEAIAAYRERRFDYEFATVEGFHELLSRQAAIRSYLEEAGVYELLYQLALAAEQYQPRSGVASGIMRSLSNLEDAGAWAQRASRFLDP